MKKIIVLLLFNISGNSLAQIKVITEEYNLPKDWIMVIDRFQKIGFVSINGDEIVSPEYDIVFPFGEIKKDWMRVQNYNSSGIIDTNGKVIIEPIYDIIFHFGIYGKNIALVRKNGLYGFIDLDGNEIVPAIYQEIPSNLSLKTH
jgi:hypothetical protein